MKQFEVFFMTEQIFSIFAHCALILLGGCRGPKNVVINLTNFSRGDGNIQNLGIMLCTLKKGIAGTHVFVCTKQNDFVK